LDRKVNTSLVEEPRRAYYQRTATSAATITHKIKIMNATGTALDLTKYAPHSPRERLAGFVIARRTIDKCRATVAGTQGEYHFDCPLDNQLFSFKGINGAQFKAAVQNSDSDEEVGAWLLANGTRKTAAEIKAWSDKTEAASMMNDPGKRASFKENCAKLGLNPETTSTFDWLEADDRATFGEASA
jgi:hypothetical protein